MHGAGQGKWTATHTVCGGIIWQLLESGFVSISFKYTRLSALLSCWESAFQPQWAPGWVPRMQEAYKKESTDRLLDKCLNREAARRDVCVRSSCAVRSRKELPSGGAEGWSVRLQTCACCFTGAGGLEGSPVGRGYHLMAFS